MQLRDVEVCDLGNRLDGRGFGVDKDANRDDFTVDGRIAGRSDAIPRYGCRDLSSRGGKDESDEIGAAYCCRYGMLRLAKSIDLYEIAAFQCC